MARKFKKKTLQIFKTTICRNFRNYRFKNRITTNAKYQEQGNTITMMSINRKKQEAKRRALVKTDFKG